MIIGLAGLLSAAEPALQLGPADRAWIAAHPVVRIQMSSASPPFEYREDGVWKGLAHDILAEAAGRLGLRIEVTGIPWSKALVAIQESRDVDLLLAVTRSPERERQMALTRPYLAFPQVVFADKRHPFVGGLEDLAHSRIAVEDDYVMAGWLRRDLPGAQLVTTNDTAGSLAAVSSGKADAYIGNLAVGSYLIERLGMVNLGVVAPTDYGDEEFSMGVRKDWPELVPLLDRAIAAIPPEQMHDIRQRWLSVRYEHGLRARDIALWVVAVSAIALVFIVQLRSMVRRRTRELKREVELRRAKEHHLAQAQRIAHVGSWSEDLRDGGMSWSDETRRILAWPDGAVPTRDAFMAAVHPDDAGLRQRLLAEARDGRATVDLEFRLRRPDGSIRHVQERCEAVRDDAGRVIALDGVIRDITALKLAEAERAQLQRSLMHSEKMRVLGQLAGGIAHDFNNLLSGISGHAELLLRSITPTDPAASRQRQYAERILGAAGRAAALTAQLRVYARRDEVAASPVDVHAVIREVVELVRRSSPPSIAIQTAFEAPAATVLGEAGQIHAALINLALNSRDAMPVGGRLSLRTELVQLSGPVPDAHVFDLAPGPHLLVTVADDGAGMDEAVLSRLFEPFFTTKEAGRGTGLGLANVYACVKNHRGAIAVDSAPGRGTSFRLWLPLSGDVPVPAAPAPVHGHGTVLVVDDDPDLRAMAAEMLQALGYRCVQSADGLDAVARYAEQRFDLVLLDMMMPGIDGAQTIARLRAVDESARVLLCSGSIDDELVAIQHGADAFIRKPYQLATLSQRIAGLISRPA